jgi:hypothetical protein
LLYGKELCVGLTGSSMSRFGHDAAIGNHNSADSRIGVRLGLLGQTQRPPHQLFRTALLI